MASTVPAGLGPVVRRFGLPLRLAVALTVLVLLGRQVGAALFEDGLRSVTWAAVVAAMALTAVTTVCSAWWWRVVARATTVNGIVGSINLYRLTARRLEKEMS